VNFVLKTVASVFLAPGERPAVAFSKADVGAKQ
jgi:hypothetical protein